MSAAGADASAVPGLEEAAAAYGLAKTALEPVAGGLINTTFVSQGPAGGAPRAVLQRLHPVFAPEVNIDIDAVTRHLADRGLDTPRVLQSLAGDLWVTAGGATWRALSYIDGVTTPRVEREAQARSAGELVGRFHRALADLDHEFAFARAGVHDTAGHLERLRRAARERGDAELASARALARDILDRAGNLPALPALPARIVHGDLKIANVLFAADARDRARCLIDLDTVSRQSIDYEIGDALRSWCNPRSEDEAEAAVDLDVFAASLAGYAAGAGALLEAREVDAIVPGLETICVELAARFCVDAFEDRYFGWDPDRYPSRREHNLARGRGQLALARSVAEHRRQATAAARAALGPR